MTAADSTKPQFFTRKATGLVRQASPFDAALYNFFGAAIPVTLVFVFLFGPAFYPGANLVLATLVALLLCMPIAVTFALLQSAIPRTGGDYAWLSRIVHPAIGFSSNLSTSLWYCFFVAVNATLLVSNGLAPLIRVIGGMTGNNSLASVADNLRTPAATFVLGAIVVLLAAAMLSFGHGLRTYLSIQRWTGVFWISTTMLLAGLVVFLASPNQFTANFDTYVQNLGGPADAHAFVLSSGGYTDPGFSLSNSILAQTLPFYALGFIFISAYIGGEIKSGRYSTLLAMPGAMLIATFGIIALIVVYVGTIGTPFLASIGLVDPTTYGLTFAPNYLELAAIASGSPIVGVLLTLGIMVFQLMAVAVPMVLLSRNLFAWSFDRIAPSAMADVSSSTASPVKAVAVAATVSILLVAVLAFEPSLTALVGLLGLVLTYVAVCIAAAVFPYRRKALFEGSPFNNRVGGIPMVTIWGVAGTITSAAICGLLLLDQNSGTSLALNPDRAALAVAIFLAGIPIWYVIRAIQRSRGVDIELAYAEIPPE
jgi:amino acid transporter